MNEVAATTTDVWSVLLPVMVGSLLTLVAPMAAFLWARVVELQKAKEQSVHIALCAALALEQFAVTCWPVSYSGREHAERTGKPVLEAIPTLGGMPSATDWRGLSVELADAVMSFHNRIDAAEVIAQHAHFYENNPFAFDAEIVAKGREAWLLAERLRKEHGLPPQTELKKSLASMLG